MLQLGGMLSRFREKSAHLSALLTRQAGKMRHYRKIDRGLDPVLDVTVVLQNTACIVRRISQFTDGESLHSAPSSNPRGR